MPPDPASRGTTWPGRMTQPRHVWLDLTGGSLPPAPGLLLMWRHIVGPSRGWEAWVVSVAAGVVRHGWVDAHHVTPFAGEESAMHVLVGGATSARDDGLGLLVDWRPVNRVEGTREMLVAWASWYAAGEHAEVRQEWVVGDRVRPAPK